MVSTQRTQSLSDFRQKATETLDRLNKTGEAEILTVNGEARAVLLAPAAYDEMERELLLARDVAAMRQSEQDIAAGRVQDVADFSRELRARLLKMRAPRSKAKRK
jgi:PHD/YefM family antitoxin component YafN of YafNO toxin-antitoxin module